MAGDDTQPGRRPTLTEQLYRAAATELGPQKTVERLDTFAKYLLGLASVAATFMSGFGLLNADAIATSWWLIVPMALFCSSLGLAVSSITPSLASLNLDMPSDIQTYYKAIITKRAGQLKWAGILFALGIFTAPLAVVGSKANWFATPVIRTSAHVTHGKDTAALSVALFAANIAAGRCVRTTVTGTMPSNTTPSTPITTTLLDRVTAPDAKGSASVTIDATPIDARVNAITVTSAEEPCKTPIALTAGSPTSPPPP